MKKYNIVAHLIAAITISGCSLENQIPSLSDLKTAFVSDDFQEQLVSSMDIGEIKQLSKSQAVSLSTDSYQLVYKKFYLSIIPYRGACTGDKNAYAPRGVAISSSIDRNIVHLYTFTLSDSKETCKAAIIINSNVEIIKIVTESGAAQ